MDCLIAFEPATLVNQLVAGIAMGGIYALVGLGLVLIYKTGHIVNFAQGDLLLWGGYTGFVLVSIGLPFVVALLGTLLVAGLFGFATERVLLRRLLNAPPMSVIIVTLGLSSILRGAAYLFAGTEVRRFPDSIVPGTPLVAGPISLPPIYAWCIAFSAATVIGLTMFNRNSRWGIALRAAADDRAAAMSMGIRISSVNALSWALSTGVASIGGVLLAMLTGINFSLAEFGLLVFPVVILGGLDSLVGALVGGLAMGIIQSAATGYLDPCVGGGLRTVAPFIALLVILLLRPHGLFGRKQIERV